MIDAKLSELAAQYDILQGKLAQPETLSTRTRCAAWARSCPRWSRRSRRGAACWPCARSWPRRSRCAIR